MSFLDAVAQALGDDAVASPDDVKRASASLADWPGALPGVVRVRTTEQVQTVLALAASHGASVAPWSQGRNWGYGTRLAPRPETYGLDLSAMNAIRSYFPRTGTLTVEPGVTQGEAARWLSGRQAHHYLDVTGASPSTSVLGNTLERGIAYNSSRADTLQYVEVVLADGRRLQTGFSWLPDRGDAHGNIADAYRHGIGPNLTELFIQSNLGIVTAATIRLRPIAERQVPIRLSLRRPEDLSPFLERLAELKERLKLDAIFHIGNQERTVTTLAPMIRAAGQKEGIALGRAEAENLVRRVVPAGWAALGQVEGTQGFVRHALSELRSGLRTYCSVRVITSDRLRWQKWLAEALGFRQLALVAAASIEMGGLTFGRPTGGPMRGVYWPYYEEEPHWAEPEHGRSGWLLLAPLFPPYDGHVERVLAVIQEEAERASVRPGVTVNLLNPHLAQAIVSLSWPREEANAAQRAHDAQRRATERLLADGYPPYRAALGEMGLLQKAGPTFFETAARIKRALDPSSIIAPGRYIPE